MTTRLSTGARNGAAQTYGIVGAFNRGVINIYSGAQPVNADAAATGTLLGTVTLGSGALTPETQASGVITITGGATSVLTVTVGTFNIIPDGAVPFNTSVNQTASDLCDAINRNGIYAASVAGPAVTIKPRPGAGASHNGYITASTGSVTATYSNMTGGISAINALVFAPVVAGVLSKPATAVWSFNGIAAGTAGWFRYVASVADAGAANTVAPFLARLDGSVATSGGDMNLSNIVVAVGVPTTIDALTLTLPAA